MLRQKTVEFHRFTFHAWKRKQNSREALFLVCLEVYKLFEVAKICGMQSATLHLTMRGTGLEAKSLIYCSARKKVRRTCSIEGRDIFVDSSA